MKKNQLLVIGGIAFLLVVTLVFFTFVGGKKTPSVTPGGRVVPPIQVNPTTATLKVEADRVIQEGGKIPYDFEVISVGSTEAKLKAKEGETTLPNDPLVKVFKRVGTTDTAATFSDLKVGQKLVLVRATPPSKELNVYIVSE